MCCVHFFSSRLIVFVCVFLVLVITWLLFKPSLYFWSHGVTRRRANLESSTQLNSSAVILDLIMWSSYRKRYGSQHCNNGGTTLSL